MRAFLGCSGFYYNHWRGKFYPENLPKKQWLQYYTQFFNTLEVNNTFYRYPTEKLLLDWYGKSPADFRFTLKANRAITHTRKFQNTERLVGDFYKLAYLLKEKLLSVLFQLPPFMYKDMELLKRIAGQMDLGIANILEFRHKSWWDSEVYDFLTRHGLVFCCVSAPDLPDSLVKTGRVLYVRFHGKNGWYNHSYSDEELASWAQKIKQQNSEEVLCYFNNDTNANAPRNCMTLEKLLHSQNTGN